jgi:hypothetical protein
MPAGKRAVICVSEEEVTARGVSVAPSSTIGGVRLLCKLSPRMVTTLSAASAEALVMRTSAASAGGTAIAEARTMRKVDQQRNVKRAPFIIFSLEWQ